MPEQIIDRFAALIRFRYDSKALDRFEAGVARVQKRLDSFSQGAARVGLVATGALAVVANKLVSFESAFNELGAVFLNETGENMALLRQQALQLGSTTSKTASDAVRAQTELARSGLTLQQTLAATPATLNLAIAGNLEMAQAAQLVGAALKSYQFDASEAGRVTDVFAAVASKTAFTVQGIGPAFRSVGALAASFGIEFEQTMALLGTLRTAGLIPEQAGTALRNIIAILSEDPSDRVAEGFAKLGLNFEQVRAEFLRSRDVVGIMRMLQTAGLDAQGALEIFGREAGNGAIILANQGQAVAALNAEFRTVTGTADEMRERMESGLPGAVAQLTSALEGLMLALGDAGLTRIIQRVAEGLTTFIRWLTNAEPWVRRLIMGALLAGPALLGLAAGARFLSFAMGGLGPVLRGLRVALGILTSPLGIVKIAIVALGAAATFLVANWERVRTVLLRIWEGVSGGIFERIEDIQRWFRRMTARIPELWDRLRGRIRDIAVAVRAWWDENAAPVVTAAWTALRDTVVDIAVKVGAWWEDEAVPAITAAWEALKTAVVDIAVRVWAWWQAEAVPAITAAWQALKTAVTEIAVRVWAWWQSEAVPAIVGAWDALRTTVADIAVRVRAWWDTEAVPFITHAWETLRATVTEIGVRVRAWWDEEGSAETQQAWERAKTAFGDLILHIRTAWSGSDDEAVQQRIAELRQGAIVDVVVQGVQTLHQLLVTLTDIVSAITSIVAEWGLFRSAMKDTGSDVEAATESLDGLVMILKPIHWFLEGIEKLLWAIGLAVTETAKGINTAFRVFSGRGEGDSPWEKTFGGGGEEGFFPRLFKWLGGTTTGGGEAPAGQVSTPQATTTIGELVDTPLATATAAVADPLPVGPSPAATSAPATGGGNLIPLTGALAPTINVNVQAPAGTDNPEEWGRAAGQAAANEISTQLRGLAEQTDSRVAS